MVSPTRVSPENWIGNLETLNSNPQLECAIQLQHWSPVSSRRWIVTNTVVEGVKHTHITDRPDIQYNQYEQSIKLVGLI